MKRTAFLVILVILILAAIGSSIYSWILTTSQMTQGHGMGQMMGAMSQASLVWLVTVVSVIGVVGFTAYYLAFPEIKSTDHVTTSGSYDVALRFLKEDEKRVVEVLRSSGNELLQKDIVKQTGLSKIKTHRVIARLAERGVVSAQREGRTNRVKLLIQ